MMMKNLANFKIILLVAICLASFGISAEAQKRRTTRTTKSTSTRTTTTAANSASVKSAAETVGNQIKNLTQFVYLLGNSVALINSVEEDVRTGKISQSARQQADAGKKGLVLAIRTFKNAMAKLEDDFRANTALRPYLLQLTGVSELAGEAEDQAANGQFEQAGRSLIGVIGQLTDVLQAMP